MKQRKTNDQEILRLLKEGKNQKEIAQHFGVSPVAIHKRLKRLTPPPETPHFNQLTDKEKRFVLEKVKGKSNIQAVMQSYDVISKGSAKSMASQLMAKPEIQMSINELMEHCGIDRPYRIRRLKQVIDAADLNIAHKGLDMSFKLDGSYAAEKHLHGVVSINEILSNIHRSLFGNKEEDQD
jgi:predicted transcriptional regulator